MNRNSSSTDYLSYSKKEKLGILCFLAIVATVCAVPYIFFHDKNPTSLHDDPSLLAAIDTLQYRKANQTETTFEDDAPNYYQPVQTARFEESELFVFDPNLATGEEWKRLGLNERTIKTILNYRSKGGKFYKKEDLQKIWGLPKGFYERVENYVAITKPKSANEPSFTVFKTEKKEIKAVDINTADTSAFIALPGIGSKLANRIVSFRAKLGGFYSIEQIREVYGLPDSTFQKIKPMLISDKGYNRIYLNTASKDELKSHPYIKWDLANAIVEYRNQHGQFLSIDDLKKIVSIDEETIRKIQPYLGF